MRGMIILVVLISLVQVTSGQTLAQMTCDAKRSEVDVEMSGANAVIGGLFEMRDPLLGGYACGQPHKDTIQAFEAARWALQKINGQNFVPGIKIGMKAYDTCFSKSLALKAAEKFYPQFTSSQYSCSQGNQLNLGFLGPLSSWTSKAVAKMAASVPVPVLSPRAMSVKLSNKNEYPTFMRTSPTSDTQVRAMVDTLKSMNWKRIVVVYTTSDFGRDTYNSFLTAAADKDVCITASVAVEAMGTDAQFSVAIDKVLSYKTNAAVFLGSSPNVNKLFKAIDSKLISGARQVQWMLNDLNRMERYDSLTVRGVVVVAPKIVSIPSFESYFTGINERSPPLENPWFADWYMTQYKCLLPGVTYRPYAQLYTTPCSVLSQTQKKFVISPFVSSTIKAVYAYAIALRNAQSAKCPITDRFCSSLQQMSTSEFQTYLKAVDFTFSNAEQVGLVGERLDFDINGDNTEQDFSVYNYRDTDDFTLVGSYSKEVLTVDVSKIHMYSTGRISKLPSLPSSPCPADGCLYCEIPRLMVEFMYTPGDVVIAGVSAGHGEGDEPFSCGEPSTYGYEAAVTFQYAINTAKTFLPGILPGVNLGGLMADICGSGHTGRLFMNNVLGGRHVVRDRKGQVVDRHAIKAMVNTLGSTGNIEFYEGFSKYNVPVIAPTASSVDLKDKSRFKLLSQAAPADDKQAIAIANLLARFGWTYIQTVNSKGSYGQAGVRILREIASYGKICVSGSYEIETDGSYEEIVAKIRSKQNARVVVFFTDSDDITGMLQAVKKLGIPRDFIIIGTDTWASRKDVISGVEGEAHGAITVAPEKATVASFETWLRSLNPRTSDNVPGFKEYYQLKRKCYIDAEYKAMFSQECSNLPITVSPLYEFELNMYQTMNSVYSAAQALHKTLQYFCGDSYSGVCVNFRTSASAYEILNLYIRNTSFITEPRKLFAMENGEGTGGYEFFSYNANTRSYSTVGSYSVRTGSLNLDVQNVNFPTGIDRNTFKSSCPGNCVECAYIATSKSFVHIEGDILLGGIFAVHDPDTKSPFACGVMRTVNGIQFVTAMTYAIERVNKKAAPVSLRGIDLGGLLIDHCNVYGRSFDLVSSLYSGLHAFPLESDFDTSSIKAWVTDNTVSSMYMQSIASTLNLPLLSPFATSEYLVDKEQFPTFYRTVEGDTTLAVAMAKLVKSLNFNYLTIVYSNDAYGKSGLATFNEVMGNENLCAISTYAMDGKMTASEIIQTIALSTSHVVILWTNSADSAQLFSARAGNTIASNVVFVVPMPLMSIALANGAGADKTFMLNIKTSTIRDYLTYLSTLTSAEAFEQNPFLIELYMTLFKCDLPGFSFFNIQCPSNFQSFTSVMQQDNYVVPTINAVYAFTAAVDAVLREKCGQDYNGMCNAYLQTPNIDAVIMEKMQTVSFIDPIGHKFEFLGREGNTGLDLYYYDGNSLKVVGEFAGASLQVTDNTLKSKLDTTSSTCLEPCLACVDKNILFTYKPGDILLGGLFDVHARSLTPFSCGSLLTWHGFQLLEAFNYAIDKVNEKSGLFANVLKDIKLGGFAMDSCQSAIRTGYLVSNIHNGLTKLTRNADTINPDDINVYIGAYSSDSSIYLGRILKSLKVPQISYASTSIQLMDQVKYPYFMRSVPADDHQAEAMVMFLEKQNIRYVQVVHTRNNYGVLGAKTFEEKASQYKICVAQNVEFTNNGSVTRESANDLVLALLSKPVANTVIVFADTDHINEMLKAIRRNPDAHKRFQFIGSETWGTSMEAISGSEDLVIDSVTLTLESSYLSDFDIYLGSKSPGNYPENPWFPEYYEEMVNCYLTVPNGIHSKQCTSMSENIVAQRDYVQDPGNLHVINAVFSTAIGIDLTLKEVCGNNYNTVCEKYRNSDEREDLLMKNIERARFIDPSGSMFEYSKTRRDGNKGYMFYSLKKKMLLGEIGYSYEKIGTFSSDKKLSIDSTYKPSWDGSCDRQGSCTECPTVRNQMQRYMTNGPAVDEDAATLVALIPIHRSGSDPYRCGSLNMHALTIALAFTYTLEKINLQPFNVRGLVLDNCGNNLRIDQDVYNLLANGKLCNSEFSPNGNINNFTVSGLLTVSSSATVALNRVVKPLKIPILSSAATSTALADQREFPYFARTVPPDDLQMSVIANILKTNGWEYFSVVYSPETYGITGLTELRKYIKGTGVCIASAVSIPISASDADFETVVQSLVNAKGSRVVVVIVSSSYGPRNLLLAAQRLGALNKFIWIGTDSWETTSDFTAGLESGLLGSIAVTPRSSLVRGFMSYLTEITYTNRRNIPDAWFEEYYQNIHKCQLIDASIPMTQYSHCDKREVITDALIQNYPYILHTIAATYAMVKGLDTIKNGPCSASQTFKACFSDPARWDTFFKSILDVDWNMNEIETFIPTDTYFLDFNAARFWDVGYIINAYIHNSTSKEYFYKPIGRSRAGQLNINNYNSYKGDQFTSKCPAGQACDCEVVVGNQHQALVSNLTIKKLSEPRNYFFYNEKTDEFGNKQYDQVFKWPIWAVVVGILTGLGLLVTLILFVYFLAAYPVRGGTTILGFMLLIGIIGIYATNFAFFVPAAESSCTARRLLMGLTYCIVFAALLVKAVDNWRYSDMEYSVRKYKGITSACSLFMAALGIVAIEIIIPVEWLILVAPTASLAPEYTGLNDWMWCDPPDMYDKALIMSMIYVIFLVIVTGIFSALAWDSDSNIYESRWIFVSCVCTAGCFLVWMIVSTNAGPPYRDPAVAIANFVNASCLLIFIPIRKLTLLIYFKNHEEADKIQQIADERHDVYSTVYSNQGYDGDMFQPIESKHSGSEPGFENHNL